MCNVILSIAIKIQNLYSFVEMDEDYEMTVNSNMISGKSLTVRHVNNNDMTLLNHNTLNALSKCNSKSTIMLPTSISTTTTTSNSNGSSIISSSSSNCSSNSANIMLAGGNTNYTAVTSMPTSLNSNEALHTRLTFTSPKLVNSRAAIETNIAIDCFETDTVDSSIIKEEPMSPDSSCPPSPIASASTSTTNILDGTNGHIIVTQPTQQISANSQFGTINVNLANVATYTNTDLVFEHNKVTFSFVSWESSSSLTLNSNSFSLSFTLLRIIEWFIAAVTSFT